ncbi:hypothetical protein RUM43_003850 [Polyplax serrata]|uniref:Uncharacterized protein n=1 Tax=Polyplax serrata TaxID=468196 RepID=A0AAN8PNP8_POLSC
MQVRRRRTRENNVDCFGGEIGKMSGVGCGPLGAWNATRNVTLKRRWERCVGAWQETPEGCSERADGC